MRTLPECSAAISTRYGEALTPIAHALAALGLVAGLTITGTAAAQTLVPAEQTAAAFADPAWKVDQFSWGDPNLEGTFTSRDMSGIQMERAQQHGTSETLSAEEFARRASGGAGGLAGMRGGEEYEGATRLQLSALDSGETGTRTFGYTSYVISPADGRIPAMTDAGRERQRGRAGGQANGPFYSMQDFSYYDRCITRGITGSILPSLYGDAMRIVQSPDSVAISYEMLHDTRIIPLDRSDLPDAEVRQYMGASIGHFEGDTLVIETRNLTDELTVGRGIPSPEAVITERIRRIDPEMINYEVTINDPGSFEAPWTFRLTLTTQPDYEILEYSCHEGNFFVANALRAEKRYQESVAEALAAGRPVPERPSANAAGLSIYQAPSSTDTVDINSTQ